MRSASETPAAEARKRRRRKAQDRSWAKRSGPVTTRQASPDELQELEQQISARRIRRRIRYYD